MTRKQALAILALRVFEAKAAREEARAAFDACDPDDSDAIDVAFEAWTTAKDAHQGALETYFAASRACETNDLGAQLALMLELRKRAPAGPGVSLRTGTVSP